MKYPIAIEKTENGFIVSITNPSRASNYQLASSIMPETTKYVFIDKASLLKWLDGHYV